MLASPATGPVDEVWFSADGNRLYARTHSGKLFETVDFETWGAASSLVAPAEPGATASVERLPAPGAKLRINPANPQRVYALANHLYRSEDGGRSWINLTAYGNASVIGSGQHGLTISPRNSEELVVANDAGVWRSLDGGLSWTGLNRFLPNLRVRRILSTPGGASGIRILVDGVGSVELSPGGSKDQDWTPVTETQLLQEAELKRTYSGVLGAQVTAFAGAGDTLYAGASDGRIWISFDRGNTWQQTARQAGSGPVESIFVDASAPRVALAALGGSGAHVLRTTNSGNFWDDLTSNLPDAAAHAITAERKMGAVYVATEDGVFFTRTDLENPGPTSPIWLSVSRNLSRAAATDVKLDKGGNQLYVALDGYGIYAAAAPHLASKIRLVNAADFSSRPAAPGSLLSVLGGRVSSARAGALDFPILASSDTESQIQVPFEVTGPTVSLALGMRTQAGSERFTFGVPLQTVAPAIFISQDGAPMLLDADSGLMLDGRNIAHSNSRIQILATGLGKVRPNWPTGLAAPLDSPPVVTAPVRAYLDRAPVEVRRATLAPGYIGFYIIELQLPAIVNAGPAELYVAAEGQESNRVSIYIEP